MIEDVSQMADIQEPRYSRWSKPIHKVSQMEENGVTTWFWLYAGAIKNASKTHAPIKL